MQDSLEESRWVAQRLEFQEQVDAGQVGRFRRRREVGDGAQGSCCCVDERRPWEEGEVVTVPTESLAVGEVVILVYIGELEVSSEGDGERASHESQLGKGELVLQEEARWVAVLDDLLQEAEGTVKGSRGAGIVCNDGTEVVDITDCGEMGNPELVRCDPHVFCVGAGDDRELGAQGASHRDA